MKQKLDMAQEQQQQQAQDIHTIQKQVEAVDEKLETVIRYLKGNELDKDDKGMIGKLNGHEKRIADLEKLRDKMMWFIMGASAIGGAGLWNLIQQFIKK